MSIFDLMSQQQSPSMGGTGGIGALNQGNSIYPQSRMDKTQYATPTQLPTSADVISSDYDPKTDAYTGMPQTRFAAGGIASIPHFDGEDSSQVEAPKPWDPASGEVKLQQYEDPKDPFSGVKSLVDYTIPKDQIKTFEPNIDQETGNPMKSGRYILGDGTTLGVDESGVVHAATPGRNDYTLNKEGYYQPTGSNLTWDGNANRLTKKVGGVDVEVPNIFHKGGYQDAKGNLRTDENGVPVALAPNYMDSGAGASWVSEYAPYMTAALLTAGAGLAAMPAVGATEAGIAGGTAAGTTAGTTAGTVAGGTTAGTTTAGGLTSLTPEMSAAINSAAAPTYSTASLPYGITSVTPTTAGGTLLPNAITIGGEGALGGAAAADVAAKTAGMTGTQKFLAASMAAKALSGGSGGGGGSYTTTTTEAPRQQQTQNIASNQFQPSMMMPNMYAMNQSPYGISYQPQIYNYNTRYMAQGGVADLGGYAVGGKLLKGAGDGMSDDIEANIGGSQPARLADGEFVIPADVVSHLGNGSTDAGAKQLYRMMDKIRQARTGNKKQGRQINPEKFFPKE